MGFFSDFIGSFTGKNERDAAKDIAAGYQRGINFTKEEIANARQATGRLYDEAFKNIQIGVNASLPITQQTIAAQLQALQASPEGPKNALTEGVNAATQALLGGRQPGVQGGVKPSAPMSKNVITSPFNDVQVPEFRNPLLGAG